MSSASSSNDLAIASAYDYLTPIQFGRGNSGQLELKSPRILIGSDGEGVLYLFKKNNYQLWNILQHLVKKLFRFCPVELDTERREHCLSLKNHIDFYIAPCFVTRHCSGDKEQNF